MEDVNKKLLKEAICDAESLVLKLKKLKKSNQWQVPGWCIYESAGYWRASRRDQGRVWCVALGKTLNREEAASKIKKFEKENQLITS